MLQDPKLPACEGGLQVPLCAQCTEDMLVTAWLWSGFFLFAREVRDLAFRVGGSPVHRGLLTVTRVLRPEFMRKKKVSYCVRVSYKHPQNDYFQI